MSKKAPVFAFIDGDITFRHTLWHFLWGIYGLVDALVSIFTLGFVSTMFSVRFTQSAFWAKLYDHGGGVRELLNVLEKLADGNELVIELGPEQRNMSDDEIRDMIAEKLNLPKDTLIVEGPRSVKKDRGVFVIPTDKEKDTWH